jgi:predicted short-subunit dehydrogenase-like oxidoreductase (DUF2520 family)
MRLSIIGAGQAGRGLGLAFRAAGAEIECVFSRRAARARETARALGAARSSDDLKDAARGAGLVIVAVPDAAIEAVAASLEPDAGAVVAHTCGAAGAEAVAAVRRHGAFAGAMHPLRSFADPERAARGFEGTACAIDGDPPARERLREAVALLRGVPLEVRDGGKPLYHAGAVFASNYLVAALEAALRLFEAAGVPRRDAAAPLAALAEGTLANVRAIGVPAALSGPVERGDDGTVRRHLEALGRHAPGLVPAYEALGRLACEVAAAKGSLDASAAERMRAALAPGGAR